VDWLRLWHDMPNDPKWRTIARVSGQPIALVQAIWLQIMVSASQSGDRGTYEVLEEDISSSLDASDDSVAAIIKAMQGRVLDGKRLTGWERRQPSREDGSEGKGKAPGSNYVYYVVATDSDVVKIGISRNPWSRVKDLQTGSASSFELLATLKTDVRSERELHKFFQDSRISGEWFRRSKALNSLIEKTKSKEILSFEQSLEFLESLSLEDFSTNAVAGVVGVVTTKDTDTDTDTEETTHITRTSDSPPAVIEDHTARPRFAITDEWEPNPKSFTAVLHRNGMANQTFHADQLLEFRSYWISRPDDLKTQAQWEHALAQQLKRQARTQQAQGLSHETGGRTDQRRTRNAHDILTDTKW